MKVKYFVLILWTVAGLFTSCHSDNDVPKPPTPEPAPTMANRTVLVYIVADNASNDLSSHASNDLKEMLQGIESVDTKKNNLIVYMDRKYVKKPVLIRLCRNTNNEIIQDTLKTYQDRNSVGVDEMKETLSEVFSDYPAKRSGLVLWSHAEGWIKANTKSSKAMVRSFGEDNGSNIDIADMHEVLEVIPHQDFILFDACFMQTIEVAYELRDRADFFLGSPTEIPGPGAPYQNVVPAFFKSGSSEEVAKDIAAEYFNYYSVTQPGWSYGASMGALKAGALDALADATRQVINHNIGMDATVDVSNLLYYNRSKSYYYTDMNEFVKLISSDEAEYYQWKQAFDNAVVYFQTTPTNYSMYGSKSFSMEGSCGVSMYIPCRSTTTERTSLNEFYRNYQWYTDVGWASKGW